jgi:uncharacterized membrane protein
MKNFFDGFDWEMAIEFVLFAVAVTLILIGIIWAIAIDSLWPFLLWVPSILLCAVLVGKGCLNDDEKF